MSPVTPVKNNKIHVNRWNIQILLAIYAWSVVGRRSRFWLRMESMVVGSHKKQEYYAFHLFYQSGSGLLIMMENWNRPFFVWNWKRLFLVFFCVLLLSHSRYILSSTFNTSYVSRLLVLFVLIVCILWGFFVLFSFISFPSFLMSFPS